MLLYEDVNLERIKMSNFHQHSKNDLHTHDESNKSNINIELHDFHQPKHHHKESLNKLKIVLCLTLVFAVVELIAALKTHSLALLSDFSHMLTDSLSLLIAISMAALSIKPANKNYSYGHGRADTVGAFVNALFMLSIIIFIFYEGVTRIIHPEPVNGKGVLIVAALGLLVNIIAFKILHSGHNHDSLNNKAALLHVMGDLLGSVIAIIAGAAIYFTGLTIIDPLLSIFVSFVMLIPTINIIKSSVKIIMEGVPDNICYESVGASIEKMDKVASVHDLHIWIMDSQDVALTAHVVIPDLQAWNEVLKDIQEVLLKEYKITHVTIQPELI